MKIKIKEVWNLAPKEKKIILLKTLGYKKQWVNIKYEDLSKRGGGLLKRDLDRLHSIISKKKR